ncbi:hypothetical protein [Streptomyces sp. AK08-02]|uniref:hypothetical protein n=1 Tax=Streptomyces sp. AK08-02 TaxID=3028654 RepID=UPI0029B61B51|nr:hypothetical protein [Streptomyces sp. AK08-02]MDX3746458.1 hypothetical protein [Streptomyces sp. AK08-02]
MTGSGAVRSLRAAVFAVLCVLLAAGGHLLAAGVAPPVWAQAAGAVPVFLVGCLLGGRERSLGGIVAGTLASQGGLHFLFHAIRPTHAAMVMHGMRMAPTHALTPHATVVHVGAAVVLAWWLRRGEAAVWSLLRCAATLVPGLVGWWRGGAVLPAVPEVGLPTARAVPPRVPLLRFVVCRRGPPDVIPYET